MNQSLRSVENGNSMLGRMNLEDQNSKAKSTDLLSLTMGSCGVAKNSVKYTWKRKREKK